MDVVDWEGCWCDRNIIKTLEIVKKMTRGRAVNKNGSSWHHCAVMGVFAYVLALAFMPQHVWLRFSNSAPLGFRLKEVSFRPRGLCSLCVFSTGLRVFSVEIVINLLCAAQVGQSWEYQNI